MTPLYVFDLDGTLADCTHRLKWIKNGNRRWTEFFKACVDDVPIRWAINLYELCRDDVKGEILILTGRSEIVRKETNDWLTSRGIMYDYLVMRPEKNSEQDHVLKVRMLEEFLRDKDYSVQFIVEDRTRVVKAYREKGYNVLQCADGDF